MKTLRTLLRFTLTLSLIQLAAGDSAVNQATQNDKAFAKYGLSGKGVIVAFLDRGIDYHDVKPMVSALFPLTFDYGLLHPSNEIVDRSLQCIDDGPTLYRGVRDEVTWYFGPDLVVELDRFEAEVAPGSPAAASRG